MVVQLSYYLVEDANLDANNRKLAEPSVLPNAMEGLYTAKKKQAEQYNQHVCDLPLLHIGDKVRVQPTRVELERKVEVVVGVLPHRSYEVNVGALNIYRRNRQHLCQLRKAGH